MKKVSQNLWVTPPMEGPDRAQSVVSCFLNSFPLGNDHSLLFNGLTGAIDILDRAEFNRLTAMTWTAAQENERTYLYSRGHLARPDAEARMQDELIHCAKGDAARQGITFFLSPTNFCSMGCRYCLEGKVPKTKQKLAMNQEQVDAAWNAMASICEKTGKSTNYLALFGGEPLQEFTFESVQTILEGASARSIKVLIFTNGLSMDRFAPLLERHRNIILAVHTTLDGPEAYHNSLRGYRDAYERVNHAVNRLLEHQVPVTIRTNLTKTNINEIPAIKRIYMDCGWWDNPLVKFELSPITNHGDDPALDALELPHHQYASTFYQLVARDSSYLKFRHIGLFSHLYYLFDELGILPFDQDDLGFNCLLPRIHGCSANSQTGYALCADGTIHHCNEDSGDAEFSVGTFWPDFQIDPCRSGPWVARTVDTLAACGQCSYRFVCAGGCSRHALRKFNDLTQPACESVHKDFQDTIEELRGPILAKWGLE